MMLGPIHAWYKDVWYKGAADRGGRRQLIERQSLVYELPHQQVVGHVLQEAIGFYPASDTCVCCNLPLCSSAWHRQFKHVRNKPLELCRLMEAEYCGFPYFVMADTVSNIASFVHSFSNPLVA